MNQPTRFSPKKSLGQHFLADLSYVARIADAADLTPADAVLEIGPGQGVLTRELAARAGRVVAVELDNRLIQPLQAQFALQPNVRIMHGDILEIDPAELMRENKNSQYSTVSRQLSMEGGASLIHNSQFTIHNSPFYKVVANLPYYITSAVLRHLLETDPPPTLAVIMVQWEVAQRICAQPGDLSLLAVSVQYYAEPHLVCRVPASAFRPQPKVDSAVLRLDVRDAPVSDIDPQAFFAVVRAGFGQKRKQLLNSLPAGLGRPKTAILSALAQAAIEPTRRAETLSLPEWGRLCKALRGDAL